MQNTYQKNTLILSLAALALGLSACREVVVINPGAPCRMVDREVCHNYRDYHGRFRRECRIERREVCGHTLSTLGFEVSPVALADKFNISVDAAEQVTEAMVQAKSGNLESAKDLGLSNKDLSRLSKLKMPTAEGLDRVSQQLDMNPEDTAALVSALVPTQK